MRTLSRTDGNAYGRRCCVGYKRDLPSERFEVSEHDRCPQASDFASSSLVAALREDISSEVSKIAVPTLVLAGELDKLDSVEQHKREVVARISQAEFASVKSSGHLIPIDESTQLSKLIGSFVPRLS